MAPPNVILQAGSRVHTCQVYRAGGNAKRFMDEMDDPVCEAVRKIRTEVDCPVFYQGAGDVHSRKFFKRGKTNVRVSFVVAQQYVKFWLVLLDQVVFKRQRLTVVVHNNALEVGNFADQRTSFGIEPPRFQKV